MSITREDIMHFTAYQDKEKQLELFEYWSEPEMDPRLKTPTDMVQEFHTKAEQVPDPNLYSDLVVEEFDELMGSVGKLEELKEIADLIYVLHGYAYAMGYNLDEAIRRVHENNLGRMIQDDGTIRRREDGKIIKNPKFPKVKLDDLV